MGETQKKSGLRILNAGDVLFRHNEPAKSLYIIQKGQVRLFIPKGKGFVELAVLRSGEVIGEMGYFDSESTRRSCSAEAIITTEVVEISYGAFDKTMNSLNPWFKTIITTLAGRLRKTNERVKQLESNSMSFGADGKVSDYKFFRNSDIVKILSLLFFMFKNHGDKYADHWELSKNKVKFYMEDVFAIPEVKYENFINLLAEERIIFIDQDTDSQDTFLKIDNPDYFRDQMIYINTQRAVDNSKKIVISDRCENILTMVNKYVSEQDEIQRKEIVEINLTKLYKEYGISISTISPDHLLDAVAINICSDILVRDDGNLVANFNYPRLAKFLPGIILTNAIKRFNAEKER